MSADNRTFTDELVDEVKATLTHMPLERVLDLLEETHDLRFGDALRHFSEKNGPVARQYATYARENYNDEGTVEIDDPAVVSLSSDRGAYVLAWRWVGAEAAGVTWHQQEKEMVGD